LLLGVEHGGAVQHFLAMPVSRNMVPLDRVSRLDKGQVEKLRSAHIATVEELVGQLEADPEGVGSLLDLDRSEVAELAIDTKSVLPAETLRQLSEQSGKRYSYGALNPHED
jgi:hypothetical protein